MLFGRARGGHAVLLSVLVVVMPCFWCARPCSELVDLFLRPSIAKAIKGGEEVRVGY